MLAVSGLYAVRFPGPLFVGLFQAAFSGAIGVTVLLVGTRSQLRDELQLRDLRTVAGWMVVGFGSEVLINGWLTVLFQTGILDASPVFYVVLLVLSFGLAGGAVLGIYRVQNRRRTQAIAEEREQLTFLNRLLRHNVLNDITIIDGSADLHSKSCAESVEAVETITERTAHTEAFIRRARSLIQAILSDQPPEEHTVGEALDRAIEAIGSTRVSVERPESPTSVLATDALSAVFESLLVAFVSAAQSPETGVSITVDSHADRLTLSVSNADGSVPPEMKTAVEDPSADTPSQVEFWMALLTDVLADWGGTVRVVQTDPATQCIQLCLPTEPTPQRDASGGRDSETLWKGSLAESVRSGVQRRLSKNRLLRLAHRRVWQPVAARLGVPATITTIGAGLLGACLGYVALFVIGYGPLWYGVVGAILPGGLGVVLVAVGSRLSSLEERPTERRIIAGWIVAGALSHVLLVGWLSVVTVLTTIESIPVFTSLVTLAFGAGSGLAIGIVSLQRRLSQRVAHSEQRRLESVNHTTRSVLEADMSAILDALDCHRRCCSNPDERLSAIEERTEGVLTLVSRVGVLLEPDRHADPKSVQNLASVVQREVSRAQASYELSVETAVPDNLAVCADASLNLVFESLLSNAVSHSDTAEPTVRVSAADDGASVSVRVADNGPGIPDRKKQSMFELDAKGDQSSGTGFGLHLVSVLLERFDGDVHIEDNDPRGAVFCLRLQAAPSTRAS